MADYTQWRPVVNMDVVNQARRQRAVLGREPKVDDPSISGAYMVTRPTPNTRMDVPVSTPNPVAIGIAKMQEPDPTNVPVSPEAVRRAQDGVSGVTGIQVTPDVGLNDVRLQQDLQDKRAWTASAADASGTATVADSSPTASPTSVRVTAGDPNLGIPRLWSLPKADGGPAPISALGQVFNPEQARYEQAHDQGNAYGTALTQVSLPSIGMADRGPHDLRSDNVVPIIPQESRGLNAAGAAGGTQHFEFVPAKGNSDLRYGKPEEKKTLTLVPNAVSVPPPRVMPDSPMASNRELLDYGIVTPEAAPSPASPQGVATPNFIARATDVLPQAWDSGAAPGVSPSEAQIAQLSDSNYTPLADRMASLNAGIAAMQDLGRAKANAADGLPLDTDRSKWGVKVVGDPSWDEAMKDYAAGRVGSPGYGMIRNLKMEQEEAAQQTHGRRGKAEAIGLQIPSDPEAGPKAGPKAGRDASLQDALAMMQYDRGLRNDQQQVAQHNADNTLKLAGLQQQGDIAERTDARERATLDQRKAKEQGEQYDADAAVEIGALPQTLGWAAPIADRFYAAGKRKFRTAAEATQALGAVTGMYANNQEKGFKYKDGEEYSNADAVRIVQGTYDGWGNRVTGMSKEDREARQAAAREYLMARALEVNRGR